MTFLYTGWYLVAFLRSKNKVKLTMHPKCRKPDMYGELGFAMWGNFILMLQKGPRRSDFQGFRVPPMRSLKSWTRKIHEGRRKKIMLSQFFWFSRKWLYFGEEHWVLGQVKLQNSFASFGPLMTTDGALESWHQDEVIFALMHLAGDCLKAYLGVELRSWSVEGMCQRLLLPNCEEVSSDRD